MVLASRVRIAPRFQRAIRIDADLHNPGALDGFICTATFGVAITTLAEQVGRTGQGAFTWTGPYGGGKSSLVIALAALLGPPGKMRNMAMASVGREVSATVQKHLKPGARGWQIVPAVGRRASAAEVVADALRASRLMRIRSTTETEDLEARVLASLEAVVKQGKHDGLLLIIDELGKTFEHAAATGGDLYFYQRLADLASRSRGKLVVLGILHQAFDEYATRLARELRDEWAKIQGRFLDIPLQVASSEQLEVLSRAITSKDTPPSFSASCRGITAALRRYKTGGNTDTFEQLTRCWPLHPVTACLLGPVSRRRFGQNQRSVFGFLNSSEPQGFQDFLHSASGNDVYGPARLWDYLQSNLEPAILASSDGHRWSLAVDAVERCESKGGSAIHVVLVKVIALLDLLRERSGLYASEDVLRTTVELKSVAALRDVLRDLQEWSVVVYREHLGAYSVYAGSDFDIEAAVEAERKRLGSIDLGRLRQLASLRPVVAKRHYHKTGALRWFDVDLIASAETARRVREFKPNGAMGVFLLVLRDRHQAPAVIRDLCRIVSKNVEAPVALGLAPSVEYLKELAEVLLALESVRHNSPELGGDAVARREVDARLASTASALEAEVRQAFDAAEWWLHGRARAIHGMAGLSQLASDLADHTYPECPRILNELLNRSDASSNAVAARRALLNAMVSSAGQPRLGIDGYPAEGGLFSSLLEATGLYRKFRGEHAFRDPPADNSRQLAPLWKATDAFLRKPGSKMITAAQIYDLWRRPPFGVRDGLKPVLLVAYLLGRKDRFTFYRDERFEPALNDVLVDALVQDPTSFGVKTFDVDSQRQRFFEAARDLVFAPSSIGIKARLEAQPIDVAKALVAMLQSQPKWVLRTTHLSPNAVAVRKALKEAEDPKRLLFDDLPELLAEASGAPTIHAERASELLRSGLDELKGAYASMLQLLESRMRLELGLPVGDIALDSLRARAKRIRGLTGDLRLEAFVTRLATYSGESAEFEGIASLAANKPPRDWSDSDVDRVAIELADLSQRFNRAEAFARVKGRPDGRHAIAFVVGLDRGPALTAREFDIRESDRPAVLKLAREVQALLSKQDQRDEVLLGALAQVGSDLLDKVPAQRRKRAQG